MVRSMMSRTTLPISFWGYAIESAMFILNRVPTKSVEQTPYEIWIGKKPSFSYMKIWGCEAYVKRLDSQKLQPKSDKCLFVGYPKETKGYYFYHPQENKVFVALHAVFLEKEFMNAMDSGRKVELDEDRSETAIDTSLSEPDQSHDDMVEPQPVTQEVHRSGRIRREPDRYGYLISPHVDVNLIEDNEPTTYEEAILDIDYGNWLDAMKSEMDSMYADRVWTLVEAPEGIKPIGCKWVFKRKTDMEGNVQTYKAMLVVKGYRQKQGIDFDETFSPVAMIKSIRIMLAIAAYHDYEIWQMDMKIAFLNGNLVEDVYMMQPEGFIVPENANKVCKLQRSIYGLKQASRSWNQRFDETVKEFDFVQNEDDPCVYKKVSGSALTFLLLYVDDILFIGNDIPMLQSVKTWLSVKFSMMDLGETAFILAIKIYRDRSKRLLGLSQSTYIDKVLKRFNMEQSKRGLLPMSRGTSLSKEMSPKTLEEREKMNRISFASTVGSIMYAMI